MLALGCTAKFVPLPPHQAFNGHEIRSPCTWKQQTFSCLQSNVHANDSGVSLPAPFSPLHDVTHQLSEALLGSFLFAGFPVKHTLLGGADMHLLLLPFLDQARSPQRLRQS